MSTGTLTAPVFAQATTPAWQRKRVASQGPAYNEQHNGFTPSAQASVAQAASQVVPDRYHRQRQSLSTQSLPSLSPSLRSSDVDTVSTHSSTSSVEREDKKQPPLEEAESLSNELVVKAMAAYGEPLEAINIVTVEEETDQDTAELETVKVDSKPKSSEVDVLKGPRLDTVAQKSLKEALSASPVKAAEISPVAATPSVTSTASVRTITPEQSKTDKPKLARPRSARTANQAVEEAIASLTARGEEAPSAEIVRTHTRKASGDSRKSLVLPSDTLKQERELEARAKERDIQHFKSRSVSALPTTPTSRRYSATAQPQGSALTGPAIRPKSATSRRVSLAEIPTPPASSQAQQRYGSTTAVNARRPSWNSTQFTNQPVFQPIASSPPKRGFRQKIKGLFKNKSDSSDSQSIKSSMSGMSGRSGMSNMSGMSGMSGMSTMSTSSAFSFRSLKMSSKRIFSRKKDRAMQPTFEGPIIDLDDPPAPAPLSLPVAQKSSPSSPKFSKQSVQELQAATRTMPPQIPIPSLQVATPVHSRHNSQDRTQDGGLSPNSGSTDEEGIDLAASDTVFPRSLDEKAVESIRNAVDRTGSLDRKHSTRSTRSTRRKHDEDEKVPNAQEIRADTSSFSSMDISSSPDLRAFGTDLFGALDTEAITCELPKLKIPKARREVNFASQIMIYDTFSGEDYDRRPEPATCNRLTPTLAQQIKQELNSFKMGMEVHKDSRAYTHFF